MTQHRLYGTTLTTEEKELGFIRAFVSNPDFEFYGNGSLSPAVILVLGKGDRIIKLSTGQYSHQTFGTYSSTSKRADWQPVCVPLPHPALAIRAAQSGEDTKPPLGQKVHPATASLALTCDGCSKDFDLQADYLPISGMLKCPSCGKENSAAQCERFNM
jgi:hypothetical protein